MVRDQHFPPAPLLPLTARQVAATHEALRRGDWGSLTLERFTCFARFPKWTAACYALHWEISEDIASRDLKDLQRLGVIACLQGRGQSGRGERSAAVPGAAAVQGRPTRRAATPPGGGGID